MVVTRARAKLNKITPHCGDDHTGEKEIDITEIHDTICDDDVRNVAPKRPRFLTVDKCPGRVLMHCLWCEWVKPIPDAYSPSQYQSQKGNPYVDYLTKKPTSQFKKSNVYKKTRKHLWKCGARVGKDRSYWGPFFAKSYGGKVLKDEVGSSSVMHPREQDRRRVKPRHVTMEQCRSDEVVLVCNICNMVKRWPPKKMELLATMTLGRINDHHPQVVNTTNIPTAAMRGVSQWKKMRSHAVGHGGAMVALYTITK